MSNEEVRKAEKNAGDAIRRLIVLKRAFNTRTVEDGIVYSHGVRTICELDEEFDQMIDDQLGTYLGNPENQELRGTQHQIGTEYGVVCLMKLPDAVYASFDWEEEMSDITSGKEVE